jgi:tRNA(adenine34) deaminase
MDFEYFMHLALQEAKAAGEEVPVGAVLVSETGEVLATAHNQRESKSDPTSHAEIEVIRRAGERLKEWRLENATLFVTLEPCVMCAGAIVAARIPRVVFGAWDERVGAAGSAYDILRDPRLGRPVEVISGVLEAESTVILKEFFASRRA